MNKTKYYNIGNIFQEYTKRLDDDPMTEHPLFIELIIKNHRASKKVILTAMKCFYKLLFFDFPHSNN